VPKSIPSLSNAVSKTAAKAILTLAAVFDMFAIPSY